MSKDSSENTSPDKTKTPPTTLEKIALSASTTLTAYLGAAFSETMKTHKQLTGNSYPDIIKRLFLRDYLPAAKHTAVRLAYRAPIALYSEKLYQEKLPENLLQDSPSLPKTMSILTIPLADSLLSTPFENYRMNVATGVKATFGKWLGEAPVKDIYRGTSAVVLRQSAQWAVFAATEKQLHDRTDLPRLATYTLAATASPIATMPLDMLRNIMQNPQNLERGLKSGIKELGNLVKKEGVSALSKGGGARWVAQACAASLAFNAKDAINSMINSTFDKYDALMPSASATPTSYATSKHTPIGPHTAKVLEDRQQTVAATPQKQKG